MFVHINYHGASQETSRTSKQQRNSVTVLVLPGGSSSAGRLFMEKTHKTCRFACAAWRQFMHCQAVSGKIQKT